MRVKLRSGRFSFQRTLKVSDVRRVADDCHAIKSYFGDLSVALESHLGRKRFKEPDRPTAPKVLDWLKAPYGSH